MRKTLWVLSVGVILAALVAAPALAAEYFIDGFDSQPVTAEDQTAGAWYVDRKAPASFEATSFDGDMRLRLGVAAEDHDVNAFYNTQGRAYDLGNPTGTYLTGSLYVGEDWDTETRRSDLWARTKDASGTTSGYPIIGFANSEDDYEGFACFTQDVDQEPTTITPGWYEVGFPEGFEYGSWYDLRIELTPDTYRFYVDSDLVFEDTFTYGSVEFAQMFLQAKNYAETYDAYWDDVGAGMIDDIYSTELAVARTDEADASAHVDEMVDVAFEVTNTSEGIVETGTVTADWDPAIFEFVDAGPMAVAVGSGEATFTLPAVPAGGTETYAMRLKAKALGADTLGFESTAVAAGYIDVTSSASLDLEVVDRGSGRIWGVDRYQTAAQVASEHFDVADVAVLARGDDYADALSASGLAGAHEAPILLTDPDGLSAGVSAELERLGVEQVIISGGTGAIGAAVVDELEALGYTVQRIGGTDRYETSAMLASEIENVTGSTPELAFVARGDSFPDALSASPIAWANAAPVVLTRPDELVDPAADYFEHALPDATLLVGGLAALDVDVDQAVEAIVGPTPRVGGVDRYDTAARICEWATTRGIADTSFTGVAIGTDFPDALAGGPGVGARGGVMLLTRPDSVPFHTMDFITTAAVDIDTLQVLGGPGAVSDDVVDALMDQADVTP